MNRTKRPWLVSYYHMKKIFLISFLSFCFFSLVTAQTIVGQTQWAREAVVPAPGGHSTISALIDYEDNFYTIVQTTGEITLDGQKFDNDSNDVSIIVCYNTYGKQLWEGVFEGSADCFSIYLCGVDSTNIYLLNWSRCPFTYGEHTIPQGTGILILSRSGTFKQYLPAPATKKYFADIFFGQSKADSKQGLYFQISYDDKKPSYLGYVHPTGTIDSISEPYPLWVQWDNGTKPLPNGELLLAFTYFVGPVNFSNFQLEADTTADAKNVVVKKDKVSGAFELIGTLKGVSSMQMEYDPSSGSIILAGIVKDDSVRWNGKVVVTKDGHNDDFILMSIGVSGAVNWIKKSRNGGSWWRAWKLSELSILEDGLGRLVVETGMGPSYEYDGVFVASRGSNITALNFDAATGKGLFGMDLFPNGKGKNYLIHDVGVVFTGASSQYAFVNLKNSTSMELNGEPFLNAPDSAMVVFAYIDSIDATTIEKPKQSNTSIIYNSQTQSFVSSYPIEGYRLMVYDLRGSLLAQTHNCEEVQTLHLPNLQEGIYIACLRGVSGEYHQKLFVR